MAKYEAFVRSIGNLDEFMQEISNEGYEVISTCYAADAQQIVIICKKNEEPKKPLMNLFKKEEF